LLPFGSESFVSRLLSRNVKVKIYKTIILPVVLYGCETWSLTLREEHILRVFGNRVLIEYLDVRGMEQQENGESCTMRSFIFYTPPQIFFFIEGPTSFADVSFPPRTVLDILLIKVPGCP
jgi:hypothetical protein